MLHTFPDASEIVTAVREFLEREVMPSTTGALSFHARVAANLLAVLERELMLGPDGQGRFRELLADLGVDDEQELARRIRDREVDATDDRLLAAMHAVTRDRLLVSNPKYLSDEVQDDPRSADA